MSLRAALLAAVLAALPMAAFAADAATEAAKTEIWAKEQAIYSGRSRGDFSTYVASTARGYRGWPPGRPAPIGDEGVQADAARLKQNPMEQLTMELVDFSLGGDTAVIFYRNHRTRTPDGKPADDVFENIHVWKREDGAWKLFGAMSRQKPDEKPAK